MQTMRGQSTLTLNKNSSIHLKFQFCDIIPPDTGKTTLLLVPSGGQSSLFSCVCVQCQAQHLSAGQQVLLESNNKKETSMQEH